MEIVAATEVGSNDGKYRVLRINNDALSAMIPCAVRILYSEKNDSVWPGISPSLNLYLMNPGTTALKPFFCLLKRASFGLIEIFISLVRPSGPSPVCKCRCQIYKPRSNTLYLLIFTPPNCIVFTHHNFLIFTGPLIA